MREIEIKIRTDKLEEVRYKLEQMGCEFSGPIVQEDAIYALASNAGQEWESSKEGSTVMRIRRQNDSAEFNLKKQQSGGELDNLEYETKVSNPDAVHAILAELGYKPQVEVKKIRIKCKFKDYEICLDKVDRLGSFVEIEKLVEESTEPDEVQKELIEVLESLGLSKDDMETRGYDTQVYHLDNS